MEEQNRNAGAIALAKANANLTPEEKERRLRKAQETRRKNNLERKAFKEAFAKEGKKKVLIFDSETGKHIQCTKVEAIAKSVYMIAVDSNVEPKDRLKSTELIAKMSGEFNDNQQVSVTVKLEDYLKDVSTEERF